MSKTIINAKHFVFTVGGHESLEIAVRVLCVGITYYAENNTVLYFLSSCKLLSHCISAKALEVSGTSPVQGPSSQRL